MGNCLVYTAGCSGAAPFAAHYLNTNGIALVDYPTPEVTHLLLDAPCREIPLGLLERLPESITIVGGNLERPELEGYCKLDLLKHEGYLARNAAITADCAVRVAASRLNRVFFHMPVLVIGWGRIGKCLSALLKQIGCIVTVAARKESDLALLKALGFHAVPLSDLKELSHFPLIYNTVPAPVLDKETLSRCTDSLKVDLASRQGLDGPDVIWARGLPGLYTPDSSGKLIADIFMEEVCL